MNYDDEKDMQPTIEELMDHTLIPPEVLNRDFDHDEGASLTVKDLKEVIASLSLSINNASEMNLSLVEENDVNESKTDDVVISEPSNKMNTSDDSSAVAPDNETIQEDIIVNALPPQKDSAESKTDTINNIDTTNPKPTKQNHKRIIQLTDKMEATFKYGSLYYRLDDDEIQLLKKIKDNMSSFKNHNELIFFLHYIVFRRKLNIGEELYLFLNLIFTVPHPLRYLYLMDYAPFVKKNGYGSNIREFAKFLDIYSKRRRYLCDLDESDAQNAAAETEAVLSSETCQRLIKDDIIYMINQLKSKMDAFTDYLSFVEFLYNENKTCRLEPAGYLILHMIYILPNPARYLYLLKFHIHENFLKKIIKDIKTS